MGTAAPHDGGIRRYLPAHEKGRDVLRVTLAYVVALAVAAAVASAAHGLTLPWRLLAADVAGTVVVFGFSRLYRNGSTYDAYWSVAPMVIAPWLIVTAAPGAAAPLRQLLVLALVQWWGARLTFNWFRQWGGMAHEDWRYRQLRAQTGRAFPLVELLGTHLFPTLQVYLGCLPLLSALHHGGRPLGWLDLLALVVCGGGIAIEQIADRQLSAFVRSERAPGQLLDTGLWAHSRHPNYFGEVCFWWGLWLFGLAGGASPWWHVVGAASITLMFLGVSLPMMEARNLERRAGYAAHARRVPLLVPRPWTPRTRVSSGPPPTPSLTCPPARSSRLPVRLLRALWTLPTNILGHLAGVALSGGLGRRVRSPFATATVYVIRSPGFGWVGGVTLGHAVLLHPLLAQGERGRLVLAHELAHTRQHDVLGPFYLPLHIVAQLLSALRYRVRPLAGSDPVHAYNALEETFLFFPHRDLSALIREGLAARPDVDETLRALGV